MELKLFTLCEGAFNHNGHLTIVNTIDFINSSEFPYRAPQFGIAAKLDFVAAEAGEHRLQLICADPVGKQVPYIDSSITVGESKDNTLLCVSVNMGGLLFAIPGMYVFSLLVDADEMGRIELKLNQKEKKQ